VGLGLAAGVLSTLGPVLMTVGFAMQGFSYVWTALTEVAPFVGAALGGIGQAVLWLGRLLLTNPIGLAITAIALGAYLIIKHWDAIRDFMSTLWEDITEIFFAAWDVIIGIITLDSERIRGGWNALWDGIKSYVEHAWEGIKGVVQAGVDWITKKLEWVSQAFTRARNFLSLGSMSAETKVAISAVDKALGLAPTPLVDFDSTTPPIAFYGGRRGEEPPHPPSPLDKVVMPDASMRGGTVTQNNTFNITQKPGESGEELARRTAALTYQASQQSQSNALHDSATVMP
jgi:hypothetical protein